MKKLRRLISVSLAAAMILSLTACSGTADKSESTSAAVAEETAAAGESQAQETGTAKQYKEDVVIGFVNSLQMTNPQSISNVAHNMLFKMTHNTLIGYDSTTKEYLPELATEWSWTDDKVLEFKLRDDVVFQNGDPMTSADVVATFMRVLNDETIASKMGALYTNIASVEAVDDYTVRLTLKEMNVDFVAAMSHPTASIMSDVALAEDIENGGSVGSGAWKVAEMVENDYVKLERNDDYWGELPPTKTVTIRYIPENSARLIALQNGEIDVCIEPSATELGFIEEDDKLDMVQLDSTTCYYLAFCTAHEPGDDQNLRLAVAHSLNLDEINTVATNGMGTIATSYWGRDTYGYTDSFGPYEQNLDLAKEYLAKAYPDGGAKLEITVSTNAFQSCAEVIQEQARAAGIDVTINKVEPAALSTMSKFNTAEHQAMVYSLSWNYYGEDARRPYYANSNVNKATVTDERIMELIDSARGETDDAARKAMYEEVQQINHDQAYYIPLFYNKSVNAFNKNLSGVIWEPNGYHDFSQIAVSVD